MKKEKSIVDTRLEEDFLSFIASLCEKSGIQEASTYLQEKYELNANILFFCCWIARQPYPLLAFDDIHAVINRTVVWNIKIVRSLKALTDSMAQCRINGQIEALSRLMIKNQLLANRAEQSLILQLVNGLDMLNDIDENVVHRALSNIFNYIRYHQVVLHQNDLEKVYRIIKRFEEIVDN